MYDNKDEFLVRITKNIYIFIYEIVWNNNNSNWKNVNIMCTNHRANRVHQNSGEMEEKKTIISHTHKMREREGKNEKKELFEEKCGQNPNAH